MRPTTNLLTSLSSPHESAPVNPEPVSNAASGTFATALARALAPRPRVAEDSAGDIPTVPEPGTSDVPTFRPDGDDESPVQTDNQPRDEEQEQDVRDPDGALIGPHAALPSQVGSAHGVSDRPGALSNRPLRATLLHDVQDNDGSISLLARRRNEKNSARPPHRVTGAPRASEFRHDHTSMPQVLHWIDTQVEHTLDERLSSTHGTIDIKLQVDPSLLADTYATLRISPSALLVRFETRHADIADLLCTHAASLAERLAQRTAKAASVEIAGLSESSNGSPTS